MRPLFSVSLLAFCMVYPHCAGAVGGNQAAKVVTTSQELGPPDDKKLDRAQNPMPCSGGDAAAAALEKATGAYREERRAYRMLKRQAVLGRAERALQMLVRMRLGLGSGLGAFSGALSARCRCWCAHI